MLVDLYSEMACDENSRYVKCRKFVQCNDRHETFPEWAIKPTAVHKIFPFIRSEIMRQ
jgi:hypothetical protein